MYIYNSDFSEIINNVNTFNEPILCLLEEGKTYYIHLFVKLSETFDIFIMPNIDTEDLNLNYVYTKELNAKNYTNYYRFKDRGIFNFKTIGNVKLELFDSQFNLITPIVFNGTPFNNIQTHNLYNYDRYYIKITVNQPDTTVHYQFQMFKGEYDASFFFTELSYGMYYDEISNDKFKFYSYSSDENKNYIIETLGSSNTYIKMYDSDGVLLKEDDDGGDRYNARLFINLLANKTYYFVINMNNGSQTNDFSILISDFKNIQYNLDSLNIHYGSISNFGGTDYFKFSPSNSGYYKFNNIEGVAGSTIEIRDDNGSILASDTDSGFASLASITYNFSAGVDYYLYFYFDYTFSGSYELSISKLEDFTINWVNLPKVFYDGITMDLVEGFYVFSSILNPHNFDPVNRTITFERIECNWNTNLFPGPSYLINMYVGEKMYIGGYNMYGLYFECNDGYPDERSYIPDTWCYSASLYNVKIQLTQNEWDNYVNFNEL